MTGQRPRVLTGGQDPERPERPGADRPQPGKVPAGPRGEPASGGADWVRAIGRRPGRARVR